MKAPLQLKTDPRRYWRSMDELQDGPEFKKFLAEEYPDVTPPDEMGRRKFMGVMGAAFAMAGLVGCRRPLAKILPYSKMPEQLVPGIAQQYATAWDFRGAAQGLLVTAYEGRPTKIEGNPDQPQNNGATDSYAQASILSLYDPDRSQKVLKDGAESTWREFRLWAETHFEGLRAQNGRGLHVLSEVTSSPMLTQIREDFARTYPGATWHTFEPVNRDQAIEGTRLAFGRPLRTHVDFGQADVIVALDSDFLLDEVNTLRQARDFANGRRVADPSDKMNRLYAVESRFTTTGSMADHRLRMASGRIRAYIAGIAMKLASSHGVSLAGIDLAGLRRIAGGSTWNERETQWMDAVAKDLAQNRGRCVVVAGESQPAAVHAFLHALNRALGNVGPVVRYTEEPDPGAHNQSLNRLAQSLDAGQVDTLVVLGANPAYAAPGALGMADKLKKAKNSVHLGLYRDETGALAQWHVPGTHYLETWGDARAWDGTLSLSQPLIAPLFEGKSESELLALLAEGTETDGHTQVQDFYRSAWGASRFDASWNRALHDGVVANTQYSEVVESPSGSAISVALRQLAAVTAPSANALEVVLHPDVKLYDGRFANNAWLQELPDPMTKLTWDNVALMSPQTARDLGVESGDMVSLAAGAGTLELPVWVQPGQADQSVAISLGYGRTQCGRVGDNVGVNAYSLLDASGETVLAGGKISPTGLKYKLATTQNHSSMENRPLYREATLDEFKKHPDFVDHMEESPPLKSLFVDTNTSILDREYDFKEGNQWGMAIDLNTCTGCNACVVSCQSENNVPTVGKDEVINGREMHWIRMDRYFVGDEDNPEAVQQPVVCMQCENAPCEAVCPVNATAHSDEGLNDMVYNRCIGTRYCSNNCPYKVRRFNFFDWNKEMEEIEMMGKNPNVTVRMRGVMEKCTYCTQRISKARIASKIEDRPIADGEIVTACQQVCPTDSIVFGNINDPNSQVSKLKAQTRDYQMLKWLNTEPRTSYLARLRNPNPELEEA